MSAEINLPPLPPAAPATPRPQASGELLKLLTPVDGLIGAGQSAKAEVLSLKQDQQMFQLLLKITLAGGRQTTVSATSSLPLALGASLAITQPSAGSLAISPQSSLIGNAAALSRIDTAQLPVGTLLQGKVLTTQLQPQVPGQPAVYRSMVSLLNSALSGSTLNIDSPQPLRIGTLLSAQVQDAHTLSFVPLSTRQEQLAISQQLHTQQSRQGSLDALFKALQNLPADGQSSAVRASVDKLLASLPEVQHLTSARGWRRCWPTAGCFLKADCSPGRIRRQQTTSRATCCA